jgi:hypothetical protein
MSFLFYIMAISHNLASSFTKSVGVALRRWKFWSIKGEFGLPDARPNFSVQNKCLDLPRGWRKLNWDLVALDGTPNRSIEPNTYEISIMSFNSPGRLSFFWNLHYELRFTDNIPSCARAPDAIRTQDSLFSSSIHPGYQDSLLYTYFSCIHPSSISSSMHCGAHLSLYLNISI